MNEAKILGKPFVETLSFRHHYEYVLTRVFMEYGISHKIHQYVPTKIMRIAYVLVYHYFLTYAIITLGRSGSACTPKLRKSQNNWIKNVLRINQ